MRKGFIAVKTDVKKLRNRSMLRSGTHQKSVRSFGCSECPLKGRRVVEGTAALATVDVVVVGEAPGKTEEELGIPFVGKSGQVLREVLKYAQLENVYITNVVKCRPDRNETPSPFMIKCCKSRLEDELRHAVNKKLIVACGDIATEWLTKHGEVTQNRGFFRDTEYGKVMITFHPAYVLRSLNVTDVLGNDPLNYFSHDFRRAKEFLTTRKVCKDITERVQVVKTSEDVQNMLDSFSVFSQTGEVCGVDFETSSLDMFDPQMYVSSVAITQGKEKVWCVPFKFLEPSLVEVASQAVQKVLDTNNLVMHNANFDMLVAHMKFGCCLKSVDDTMIMYYLLDGSRGHSSKRLKRLAMDWTDYGDYGVEYDELLRLSEARLIDYNCKDALVTVELREKFLHVMQSAWGESMINGYNNVVKPAQLLLFWATVNGMKVDVAYGIQLLKDLQGKIKVIEDKVKVITGRDLNLGSPKQMLTYLNEQGVNITSTGVEILEQYAGKNVIVDMLLEHRQLSKLCNTYVKPTLETHLKEGNIIHGKFDLTGTVTGRIASSDPNMQNIPVRIGPMIEMMFISRFEDGYIVKADYSQMELRVAAIYSNDKRMIEFFKTGKDIHNMVATDIYGVPESEMLSGSQRAKDARRIAKGFNFGVIYGRSAYSIAQELNIDVSDAEGKKNEYFRLFSQLKGWLVKTEEQAVLDGYVRNMFGKVRYIPGLRSNVDKIKSKALREAVNTPIQGAASDIALLGALRTYQEIQRRCLKTKFVNFVHDAMLFDVPSNELEDVVSIIKEEAVKLPLFVKTDVPLAIDTAWGKTWGDCK